MMDQFHLRQLFAADAGELVRMARHWNSRPQLEEFVAALPSVETATQFIADQMQSLKGLVGIWVGSHLAGLIVVRLTDPDAATIDYLLEREYRGQGVMTRACATVLDYLFVELHRNRIEVHCDEANIKSCAVLERLGFQREGVRREAAWYGSFYGNVVVFGMPAAEWSSPTHSLKWFRAQVGWRSFPEG